MMQNDETKEIKNKIKLYLLAMIVSPIILLTVAFVVLPQGLREQQDIQLFQIILVVIAVIEVLAFSLMIKVQKKKLSSQSHYGKQ